MKILIHSNGPMVPSGYGRQCALLIDQFTSLGHDVAVSAFHGVTGKMIEWHDVPVYPAGHAGWGTDVLIPHAEHFGADLILTLMDTWKLMPIAFELAELGKRGGPRLACWTPVDCQPLGRADRRVLETSGAIPIAMSQFGLRQMHDAGLTGARYVPHAVDTTIFRPLSDDRWELRATLGMDADTFVVGICAANNDGIRKGWPEQFRAFAMHRWTYPDSKLWVHTIAQSSAGLPLRSLADDMGIADAVRFTDDYPQVAGLIDETDMALWFNSLNLLSNASFAEGFGLPILEAQACGVPAVATNASAMPELATVTIGGEEFWNPIHRAWWKRPDVGSLAVHYSAFRADWSTGQLEPPETLSEKMARFDVDRVAREHWKPLLDSLEADSAWRGEGGQE